MYNEEERDLSAFKHSRFIFDHLVEEVHLWKILRDKEGRIETWQLVYINQPALKTWGRSSLDEIEGKTTDQIFGEGATDHYLPIVEKIITEGKPYTYEDFFPNLDKHFRFTSVPLGDFFLTIGSDITDLIKEKESLASDNELLEMRVKERTSELEKSVADLKKALAEINTLRGFIPICSNCKKIRDDEGYWQRIEEYIQDRSEAQFSHGLCPECAKQIYPKLNMKNYPK